MYFKIVILSAALAVVCAQHDSHSHAYSSQSFVLHQPKEHQYKQESQQSHHYEAQYQPNHHQSAPLSIQHAIQHIVPVQHTSSHQGQQSAPLYFLSHHQAPQASHQQESQQTSYNYQSSNHHEAPQQQSSHQAPAHHQATLHFQAPAYHATPVYHVASAHHEDQHHHEHYAYPKYEFSYQVKDPHTNDIKSAQESRDGDVVKGYYSFQQPDGHIRTVEYIADKKNGFNANVKYSAHSETKNHH